MEEKKKRDHTTLPFLKLIFPSASVWSLCLFRSFFPAHPIPPSSFYRRQTLSAAADENSASLRTHSLRSPPTTAMRYHDSRYLHRMPPLFKDRFLPFVFSRPKITPKVIPSPPLAKKENRIDKLVEEIEHRRRYREKGRIFT